MGEEFCKDFEYIDNTAKNVLDIDKAELKDLTDQFNNGNTALIITGEPGGRTLGAMNIGTWEMPYIGRGIRRVNPMNYAKTLERALPEIEKVYDKVLVLVGTQSGTKPTVISEVMQAGSHLENTRSKKTKLSLITAYPEADTGNIVREHDGVIVRLKGVEEGANLDDYKRWGFLGDLHEHGMAVTLQTLTEMLYKNAKVEDFYGIAEKGFKNIGEIISEKSSEPFFQKISDDMLTRSNMFLGGYRGPAEEVSKTACIRDNQFKGLLSGDSQAFVMGESSTRATMPGDIGLWTSWSGGLGEVYTAPKIPNPLYTVSWCKNLNAKRGKCYSIVGIKDSPLADCTPEGNVLVLKEPESETKGPLWFYTTALFAHTTVPNLATQKGESLGLFKYSAQEMKRRHHMD